LVPLALIAFVVASPAFGQEESFRPAPFAFPEFAASFEIQGQQQDSPTAETRASSESSTRSADKSTTTPSSAQTAGQTGASGTATSTANPQPKRILGVMPNFKAVSAGEVPPPPTAKHAFLIATENSFDYSAFIFVGATSALAEWTDAHKQLGEGMEGYGQYYWRGFVDKTDGNYLVIFAMPTIFHQDGRYYAMGKGGFWKRFGYSISRVAVTPNYDGHETFNVSELLGRGMAQGISLAYYPSQTRTLGGFGSKYGYAILRDAATNAFREFWPDIAVHVLHRQP
jgi:hypothetical protein